MLKYHLTPARAGVMKDRMRHDFSLKRQFIAAFLQFTILIRKLAGYEIKTDSRIHNFIAGLLATL